MREAAPFCKNLPQMYPSAVRWRVCALRRDKYGNLSRQKQQLPQTYKLNEKHKQFISVL